MVIPNTIKSIGDNAFGGCSLQKIYLPISVVTMGKNVFVEENNIDAEFNEDLTIYTEYDSKPDGWANEWNSDNRPVVWGYKGE